MTDTQKSKLSECEQQKQRKPSKLTLTEMHNLNNQIFSCFAKNNFQQDYQQIRRHVRCNSQDKSRVNIDKFEDFFEYKFIPTMSSTNQEGWKQNTISQFSRNTMRFDRKSSYFLQNAPSFMNQICKKQSFCFKSLPRQVMEIKNIEQTEKKLRQMHRREEHKYTISPLIKQDYDKMENAMKLSYFSKEEDDNNIVKQIDIKTLKEMHNTSEVGDRQQKDIKDQLSKMTRLRQIRNERTKQMKIIQHQFKSGIINVDAPLNPKTEIYKEQKKSLFEQIKKQQDKQNIHKLQLAQKQGTHHFIDISNFYKTAKLPVPIKKYDGEVIIQKKGKFNIDYNQYFLENTQHDGKKKMESVNVKREKRKQHLVNQQMRGKSYDIVSNNVRTPK